MSRHSDRAMSVMSDAFVAGPFEALVAMQPDHVWAAGNLVEL